MSYVILDANCVFDLDRGEVLANIGLFHKEGTYRFCTTDLIATDELWSINMGFLAKLGLEIVGLLPVEMKRIASFRADYPDCSFKDHSALVLADRLGGLLLTRDGNLILAAKEQGVKTEHPVWFIKTMLGIGIVDGKEAKATVDTIVNRRPQFANGAGIKARLDKLRKAR